MITVILIVVFGILFSYFATINTQLVTVSFGQDQPGAFPLYIIILVSIALGVLITYIIHLIQMLGSTWRMDNKERTLGETRKEVTELTRQAHTLEIENTKLRAKLGEDDDDEDSL